MAILEPCVPIIKSRRGCRLAIKDGGCHVVAEVGAVYDSRVGALELSIQDSGCCVRGCMAHPSSLEIQIWKVNGVTPLSLKF